MDVIINNTRLLWRKGRVRDRSWMARYNDNERTSIKWSISISEPAIKARISNERRVEPNRKFVANKLTSPWVKLSITERI